jgi:mRNA deadenylase 3'-5' endonuclease subunit Ccr4
MEVIFQVSAYASFFHPFRVEEQLRKMHHRCTEPVFTNFTQDFRGTLDYIFYSGILKDEECSLNNLVCIDEDFLLIEILIFLY